MRFSFSRLALMRPLLIAVMVILVPIVVLGCFLFIGWPTTASGTQYGISWSSQYATYLGIDPLKGLQSALDDLGVRFVRIPVYWNEVEPVRGAYTWSSVRQELDLIASRGGKALLVIGAKQPRWPEIWVPRWAAQLSIDDREIAQRAYIEAAYREFVDHPAVDSWQVENEPSFNPAFGEGVGPRKAFVKEEMRLVRQWEKEHAGSGQPRPVYTTESGELSFWFNFAGDIDGLGISVYRVVRQADSSIFHYWFLPSWFYDRRALLVRPFIPTVFVSEFQMEPWVDGSILTASLEEQFATFDLSQMQDNLRFSEHLHVPRIYFWGAEWWYWMKEKRAHPEYWSAMKTFLFDHAH